MIRTLGAAMIAATVLFGGVAFAASATMEATFGNTVTLANAEGMTVASYFMNADGTFSLTGADGSEASGTWRETSDEICLTIGDTPETCNPLDAGHSVGDSWTATDSDGATITLSIVAGR